MRLIPQGVYVLVVGGPVEHLGRIAQRTTVFAFPLVRGGGE